jgi:hypothetical protein
MESVGVKATHQIMRVWKGPMFLPPAHVLSNAGKFAGKATFGYSLDLTPSITPKPENQA